MTYILIGLIAGTFILMVCAYLRLILTDTQSLGVKFSFKVRGDIISRYYPVVLLEQTELLDTVESFIRTDAPPSQKEIYITEIARWNRFGWKTTLYRMPRELRQPAAARS